MFFRYNYFKQHNDNQKIQDYKEFYKKFSNTREFGGSYTHMDHLIASRFHDVFGNIINIVLKKNPKNIVDVGCGSGLNLPLSNMFPNIKYTGVDYAEKTIENSKKIFPNVDFHVMDAFNLKFDNSTFDLAIISEVLILYKEKSDRVKILNELERILKPNGIAIIIVTKDSVLLKMSINISKIIARFKKIPLPTDFMCVNFTESDMKKNINETNFELVEIIHTASKYGVLESVEYLNMRKYTRNFDTNEKQIGYEKNQNILKDLKNQSHSNFLMTFFYKIAKVFPSLFQFYSIYVVKK